MAYWHCATFILLLRQGQLDMSLSSSSRQSDASVEHVPSRHVIQKVFAICPATSVIQHLPASGNAAIG
jgi:hypothetical protein